MPVFPEASSYQQGLVRHMGVRLSQMYGYIPELVRCITMRQSWVEFEVYELDERGGKMIGANGQPVTRKDRYDFV